MFLANYSNDRCVGYSILRGGDGEINTRKFINTLDYSIDLLKLPEVYERVYRRIDFTFCKHGKDYCKSVINVTFKYSIKEFNRFAGNIYIKYGYLPEDIDLRDHICVRGGELVAIQTDVPVAHPVTSDVLGDKFVFDGGVYTLGKSMKVLYGVAELRKRLYDSGFIVDGIQYCRFKRSSGSSRVGKCLFIDEKLYPRMHKWQSCGLKIETGQPLDLAAYEAYISLTLSSIVGTVHIEPKNFLVIDDYDSEFMDRAVAVRADEDGRLVAGEETVNVKNTIWDGQSLIDPSLMGEYSQYGMILLRNRFFKSACFNCNIRQFFEDHHITSISQLCGRTLAQSIDDIKIITTPSSIKYLKFGSLDAWLSLLDECAEFGVVKHEKPPPFLGGKMALVHYQLLNTLQLTPEDVEQFLKPSLDYLQMIASDPAVLRHYIKYNHLDNELKAASTSNDVVYQMLGVTDDFAKTKMYYDFKTEAIKAFKKTLRRGHVLVNGNYSTLLGNPVEMMYAAIGSFNGDSLIGAGNIYSTRFAFDTAILGSRSPHVTVGNNWLSTNRYNDEIAKYVNVTDEVVCVNSIGENLLMRLSGADFDSDTVLLTDNEILVNATRRNYDRFLVPTNLVKSKKVSRKYTNEEQADLDIKTSVNKIGEIVNLSQELNTLMWNELNGGAGYEDVAELYYDISKLDILSGIEIDKAKKEFAVDSVAEIKKLKEKYGKKDESGRQIKPNFFGVIAKDKGYYDSSKKNYMFHDTTMDYLEHCVNKFRNPTQGRNLIPFSDLLLFDDASSIRKAKYHQVERILWLVRNMREQIRGVWGNTDADLSNADKSQIVSDIRNECYDYVSNIKLSDDTVYRLLLAIEAPENKDISQSLFSLLFSLPNQGFLEAIQHSKRPTAKLVPDEEGDIIIYGERYKRSFSRDT